MKRILLLLLLPLLTVLPLLAANESVVIDGVTYTIYRTDSKYAYCCVTDVDVSLETITIKEYVNIPNSRKSCVVDSVQPGVFDDHCNLRILFYSLWTGEGGNENDYKLIHPSPGFKGCENLEKIESSIDYQSWEWWGWRSYGNNSSLIYQCLNRVIYTYAVLPKSIERFSTTEDVLPRCFAYCNIKELKYNATYIPYDCFKEFKGKIVFNKELQDGEDVFKPLLQLHDESEIEVATWKDYDRARKYYKGKITVTGGETLRINLEESTFVSLKFSLALYGTTTLADVQKVTILNGSAPFDEVADLPLTPDGKYVVNNLAPNTSYVVLVEYKGEDGNVRVDDFGCETRDVNLLHLDGVGKSYIAGLRFGFKMSDGSELCDLSQSNATYGVQLIRYYHLNDKEVVYEKPLHFDADVKKNEEQFYVRGLKPNSYYKAKPYVKLGEEYYYGESIGADSYTYAPSLKCLYAAFPTAIRFLESKSDSDWSYEAKKVFCYLDEKCTKPVPYELTNLMPGHDYPIWLKIDDPDLPDYVVKRLVRTARINCQFHVDDIDNLTPTTAYMYFSHEKAKAFEPEVKFVAYWGDGKELKTLDESFLMTGLMPDTKYVLTVRAIEVSTSKVMQSQETNFTTKPLTLETEAPKIPSAGNMIARATTNISELEPNVGFQWKKYDAPESLKPSEGFAVAYGGILEGTIHNLQIDHYYNVRAFYRDMNGKEYYGKWITVDPSDFSWFEPNVHTYDVDRGTTNGAKARGYVVQGTDDIEKQGFEYWPSGDTSKRRVAYGAYAPADNGRQTILATGQLMTAELADLASDTEYTVRSFVTTSASTYYGEEITFRTLEASGIEGVAVDEAEIVPVAYYRLDGTRGERPFSGLNMVVFSDGHVEKIVFK